MGKNNEREFHLLGWVGDQKLLLEFLPTQCSCWLILRIATKLTTGVRCETCKKVIR